MALRFNRRFASPGLAAQPRQAGRERLTVGEKGAWLTAGTKGRAHQPRQSRGLASTGPNRLAGPPGLVPLAAR